MQLKRGVLFSRRSVLRRVDLLSKQIISDLGNSIHAVFLLKGATVFFTHLMERLHHHGAEVSFHPMSVSSYSGTRSSGKIRVRLDIDRIRGKDILVVEDIVDTGLTIDYVMRHLKKKGAGEIRVCSLFDKPEKRKVKVRIDYAGYAIPDIFIVGFGMDCGERYRDLPYVAEVKNG
ncbi:MAG: hypoxanthine phosphoribosyltransferase [archaeon]